MKREGRLLNELYGKHQDQLVFVIGNSSSLLGLDMSRIDSFASIGVNRILRIYQPTYIYLVDTSVMRVENERIKKTKAKKIIFPHALSSRVKDCYDGAWYSTGSISHDLDPCNRKGPLANCGTGNTAYQAVQVAYRMGAACIALAGVDMVYPKKKASHFFGDGAKEDCRLPDPEKVVNAFAKLKQKYRKRGVEVVSVSPWKTPFRQKMEAIDLGALCNIYQ